MIKLSLNEPEIFMLRSIWDEDTQSYLQEYFKQINRETVKRFDDPNRNVFFKPEVRKMLDFYQYIAIRAYLPLEEVKAKKEAEHNSPAEENEGATELSVVPLFSKTTNNSWKPYLDNLSNLRNTQVYKEKPKYSSRGLLYYSCEYDDTIINKIIDSVT
jgi:hypothetical protein